MNNKPIVFLKINFFLIILFMSLCDLPNKCFEILLEYLNPIECRNIASVNTKLRDIYNNSYLYSTEYHSCDLPFEEIKRKCDSIINEYDFSADDSEFDLDNQSNHWNTFHEKSKGNFFQMRCYLLQIIKELYILDSPLVLECGCGTGSTSLQLQYVHSIKHIFCFDFSVKAIDTILVF